MAEMSMNKAIHAAFRRDLRRFLVALENFPAGDRRRAGQLDAAWDNFDDQLDYHHQGEHEEAELEPFYLSNREAPEIREMGRRFSKVSPVRAGRFFAWLTDGATADEKTAITRSIPAPVLMVVSGVFGYPYRRNVAPVRRGE